MANQVRRVERICHRVNRASGRVDLAGEAGQTNAPAPGFPDTNGNGVTDGPADVEPGLADFADPGTEQDALAEYLARLR